MPVIKKYSAEVLSVRSSIEGVYTIEMRSLGKPFKYAPGQFLHLALDEYDPSMQWPDSRCFSMQSSPDEELIKITYSVKGKFTHRMQNELVEGKNITLKMPYGDLFIRPHQKVNTVFIAGGTGITPFLSLFNHESFKEYENPRIYLGFRALDYNIYEKELKNIEHCKPMIFYEDKKGVIDIELIFFENAVDSYCFISGPPMMISAFRSFLVKKDVLPIRIITDEWE